MNGTINRMKYMPAQSTKLATVLLRVGLAIALTDAALLAVLMSLSIILAPPNGLLLTFRDIGLLFAALALFFNV